MPIGFLIDRSGRKTIFRIFIELFLSHELVIMQGSSTQEFNVNLFRYSNQYY